MEVREHLVHCGTIVMNLQALETVLRYFLLRHRGEIVQFPQPGDTDASETSLTSFVSLGDLINDFNNALTDAEKKYEVDKQTVTIRDAFAHGRLLTVLRQPPYRLWKFGRGKNGRVPVEFSEELPVEWLKAKSDMIFREKEKVLACFHARGYRGLQ